MSRFFAELTYATYYVKAGKGQFRCFKALHVVIRNGFYYYNVGNSFIAKELKKLKSYKLKPIDGIPEWATKDMLDVFYCRGFYKN